MDLLEIVQAAAGEMGLAEPTSVVGSLQTDVRQYLSLANALGKELLTEYEWQQATKIHTFTLQTENQEGTITSGSAIVTGLSDTSSFEADTWEVTGSGIPTNTRIQSVDSATEVTLTQNATQSDTVTLTFTKTKYDLPTDFEKPINRTNWDRTNNWEMIGPKSAQEWEWLRGGIVSTGPRVRYRILGNKFQVWPLQVSESTLAFEYISKNWVIAQNESDPTKDKFTVDSDTSIFRDRLMIAGVKFKYFDAKGFNTSSFANEFNRELSKAKGQNKGAPTLSLSPQVSDVLISPASVPDGTVFGQ